MSKNKTARIRRIAVLAVWAACVTAAAVTVAAAAEGEAGKGVRVGPRARFEPVDRDAAHAGLFVGVNTFPKDSRLRPLSFAISDAVELAHLFVVELQLLQGRNTVVAISPMPADRGAAKTATKGVAAQLAALRRAGVHITGAGQTDLLSGLTRVSRLPRGERDMVLVFISTHGFELGGEVYVMPSDGQEDWLAKTGIGTATIRKALAASKAGKRVFFRDACRNHPRGSPGSRAAGGGGMSKEWHKAISAAKGEATLTSCSPGQVSWEDAKLGHGLFTFALLEALRGRAAADQQGLIRLVHVSNYVAERVERLADELGKPQEPEFSGSKSSQAIPLAIDPQHGRQERERLKRLTRLELAGKITKEQYALGSRLLQTPAAQLAEGERPMRKVFMDLCDGGLKPEYVAIALRTHLPPPRSPAPQPPAPQPPAPQPPAIRPGPDKVAALLAQAKSADEAGKAKEAIELATQLLQLAPGHAEARGIRDRNAEAELRRILKEAEAVKGKLAKDVEALPE